MSAEVAAPVMFPTSSSRRLQRGTRYSAVPENHHQQQQQQPVPSLYNLDSAFQLQEYIAQLVKRDPYDIEAIVRLPNAQASQQEQNDPSSSSVAQDGPEVDQSCWVYEHLRRLAQDLTYPLITLLQNECTRQSCPEMKAGEWLYLCVAHGNGGAMEQCCAIDYILHTLDAATALLNSSRNFPSRIAIPVTSTRHFSSLARRLSRIFAHAYFHHRELFEQAEAENALYERFLGLVRHFGLVQAEFLVIDWDNRPPRKHRTADEGYQASASSDQYQLDAHAETGGAQPRTLLARDNGPPDSGGASLATSSEDAALMASPSGGSLGRRRTDTMYLADDSTLAALDSVLSGEADVSTLDFDAVPKEATNDENELEMVESVDPFKDENQISADADQGAEPQTVPEDLVIDGDDSNVPDVEDVVPQAEPDTGPEEEEGSAENDVSWPTAEDLDKEATEASEAGQIREDVSLEPVSTPATEDPSEPKAEGEEESASAEVEASTTLPEDVDAVDVMLKTLEEERKAKLEELAGTPPTGDAEP